MIQGKNVLGLLKETRKIGCKVVENPIEHNRKLGEKTNDKNVDRGMYQQLVGRSIYLLHTILNIAYAASVVS